MDLLTFQEQSRNRLGFGTAFPESCYLGKFATCGGEEMHATRTKVSTTFLVRISCFLKN